MPQLGCPLQPGGTLALSRSVLKKIRVSPSHSLIQQLLILGLSCLNYSRTLLLSSTQLWYSWALSGTSPLKRCCRTSHPQAYIMGTRSTAIETTQMSCQSLGPCPC